MFDFKNMFSFKKLFFLVTLISFFPTVGKCSGHPNEVINITRENITNTTNNYNVSFNNNPEDLKKIIKELTKKNNNN